MKDVEPAISRGYIRRTRARGPMVGRGSRPPRCVLNPAATDGGLRSMAAPAGGRLAPSPALVLSLEPAGSVNLGPDRRRVLGVRLRDVPICSPACAPSDARHLRCVSLRAEDLVDTTHQQVLQAEREDRTIVAGMSREPSNSTEWHLHSTASPIRLRHHCLDRILFLPLRRSARELTRAYQTPSTSVLIWQSSVVSERYSVSWPVSDRLFLYDLSSTVVVTTCSIHL